MATLAFKERPEFIPFFLFTTTPGRMAETWYCPRADLTRVTGRLETGLSLRLLDQYREVKARTGIDVWIFFGHELEDEVRCCEIDKVRWRAMPQANGMGRGGMAFVGWDDLAHFVTFSTVMDGFEMARRMDGA